MFDSTPESYFTSNTSPPFSPQNNHPSNTHSFNEIQALPLPVLLMHNPHVQLMHQRLGSALDETLRVTKLQNDLLLEHARLREEVKTLKSSLHSMR
jgi:hypothetical protein